MDSCFRPHLEVQQPHIGVHHVWQFLVIEPSLMDVEDLCNLNILLKLLHYQRMLMAITMYTTCSCKFVQSISLLCRVFSWNALTILLELNLPINCFFQSSLSSRPSRGRCCTLILQPVSMPTPFGKKWKNSGCPVNFFPLESLSAPKNVQDILDASKVFQQYPICLYSAKNFCKKNIYK